MPDSPADSSLLALTGRLKALAAQARDAEVEAERVWAERPNGDAWSKSSVRATNAQLDLEDACTPAVIFALSQAVERQHVALTHVADEIKGQREHSSDPYWYSHATRVYWAQVEGVARDALATTSTEPAPHA